MCTCMCMCMCISMDICMCICMFLLWQAVQRVQSEAVVARQVRRARGPQCLCTPKIFVAPVIHELRAGLQHFLLRFRHLLVLLRKPEREGVEHGPSHFPLFQNVVAHNALLPTGRCVMLHSGCGRHVFSKWHKHPFFCNLCVALHGHRHRT